MAWRYAAGVALAIGGMALPASAGAQSVPDVSCPPFGGANTVVSGDWTVAQSFVPSVNGTLTSAQFRATKNVGDGAGDYRVALGTSGGAGPLGDVKTSGVIPESSVPAASVNLPVRGTFVDPLRVFAGQPLVLMISRPGAGANGLRLETRASGCPGSLFLRMHPTGGPFTDNGNDLVFTMFIDPSPTVKLGKRPKRKSQRNRARFTFSSNEAGVTFRCSLDNRKSTPCKSPVVYRNLKRGRHSFGPIAVDLAGNAGFSKSAVYNWKVRKPKR